MAALEALNEAVVDCRRCPRLVEWREQVAREKRAAFRDRDYWGRPMPGFGDPAARVLILGLAPGRARRQPDGPDLHRRPLGRLPVRGAAPRRAANQAGVGRARRRAAAARRLHRRRGPLRAAREPADARRARELLARGSSARSRCWRTCTSCSASAASRGRARCGCGRRSAARRSRGRSRSSATASVADGEPWPLLGCFHPSQQNTFTGQADAGDDRRGARAGARRSPGAREALRRDPALAARRRARRLVAARAAADRHQRAGHRALPARADGLVRGRGRGVGLAGRRLGARRAGPGPARRPARPAPRAAARSRSCTRSRSARSSPSRSSARRPSCCCVCGFAGRVRDPAHLVGPALACGPTCSSRACTRPPTRWTRR